MARSAVHRRNACVHLPELSLQILLRDRPAWRGAPLAIVAEDRPESPLLRLDARARKLGLRPGMRLGAARNLAPSLRAAVVAEARVREVIDDVARALQTFSPRVEPDRGAPGTFFVDPEGLGRIYGGMRAWARTVHEYLRARGFRCAVVVGFRRDLASAIARTRRDALVLEDAREEEALAGAVPLDRLDIAGDALESLRQLGVDTLGELLALPGGELTTRFGAAVGDLHARCGGSRQIPMTALGWDDPVVATLEIDPPDGDQNRLLFAIKGALHEMSRALERRAESLVAVDLELSLERGGKRVERITTAEPTRDVMLLVDLVRLRLGTVDLEDAVCAVGLRATTVRSVGRQLEIASERPRRDPEAAARAIGRLRAAFGAASVTRARLRDAHLPEARFAWDEASELRFPRDVERREPGAAPPLVRRILARPRPLPSKSPGAPEEGPGGDPATGDIVRLYGPYRVSGGWWVRTIERDYYYGETGTGSLLWLYFDRPRRRWFVQGMVD